MKLEKLIVLLLEPSFFGECWRITPCKGKETVLLFGSRFISVLGYQSNQMMSMSSGHHGISVDSCIWSYWPAIPLHLITNVHLFWKRYIYLLTTRCFSYNPSVFFSAKTKTPYACTFVEKGLHQDDEPCSILYQAAGGFIQGQMVRRARRFTWLTARCMAASGCCFSRRSTRMKSYRQRSHIASRRSMRWAKEN